MLPRCAAAGALTSPVGAGLLAAGCSWRAAGCPARARCPPTRPFTRAPHRCPAPAPLPPAPPQEKADADALGDGTSRTLNLGLAAAALGHLVVLVRGQWGGCCGVGAVGGAEGEGGGGAVGERTAGCGARSVARLLLVDAGLA